MPQQLTSAQLQQLINNINTGGVEAARQAYNTMQALGYDYAGWARGVLEGSSITGREAADFLKNSAMMGEGGDACRNLTTEQLNQVKIDMAKGYLDAMRQIADNNGGSVDRDIRYREMEQFHKEAFERNGLSIENWTMKTPMDLIERWYGEDSVENMWTMLRETEGTGLDALALSANLMATVSLAMNSKDPALKDRANRWIDNVMGRDNWNKLQNLLGDLWDAEGKGSRADLERLRILEAIREARLAAENIFRTVISPLVLDLDGDGVETISIERGIHFDHDGNQMAELTGWAAPDDGLLALDRNGNGEIDNGGELFGSYTRLQNGNRAANGFIALAELDLNHDGKIDAADPAFAALKIWRDLNQDGISQANELLTLTQAGVASLSTQYENSNKVDSQGNERRQIGQYVRSDGTVAQMHDVWLERNSGSQLQKDEVPSSSELRNLPEIIGFGSLKNLRTAMMDDTTLRGYVEEFTAQPSVQRRDQLIDLIVLRWTGADRVVFGIDSPYYDERKLFALDVASGEAIYNRNYNERPNAGPQANGYIESGYATLRTLVGHELERQVTLFLRNELELLTDTNGDLYFDLKTYDQQRAVNPQQALTMLVRLVQSSGPELLTLGWNGYEKLRQEIAYFSAIPEMVTFMRDSLNIVQGNGEVVPLNDAGAAIVLGGAGNDNVRGGRAGRSIIYGDAGNDRVSLFQNDTYVYGIGCGDDMLSGSGLGQTVVFDSTVLPDEVAVSSVNENLVLTLKSGEKLSIDYWFYGAARDEEQLTLNRFIFSDGTVWAAKDISDRISIGLGGGADQYRGTFLDEYVNGKAGDDYMSAGGGTDFMVGGKGNDWIYSGEGNNLLLGNEGDDHLDAYGNWSHDFLEGGTGNDSVSGDSSSDSYYFERGFGNDVLTDFNQSGTGNDVIIFGPGILVSDLVVFKEENSLSIALRGTNDKVRIANWFSQPEYFIEKFQLDDGTVLTTDQIVAMISYPATSGNDTLNAGAGGATMSGGDGNDWLYGAAGNDLVHGDAGNDVLETQNGSDTLVGGTGDDTLGGGNGADTLRFAIGDGNDQIFDAYDTGVLDTVELAMRPDQVSLRRGGHNNASLFFDIEGGTQSIEMYGWFDNDDITNTLQVRFADGTVWSSQYLWQHAPAQAGNAQLFGTPESELLLGDAQDNLIQGHAGADTLDGGAGIDDLMGGTGDDIYLFKRGMGLDRGYELGGFDTIQVEAGIARSDLTVTFDGLTTTIALNGTGDQLVFQQYYQNNRVEQLRFADGSTVDLLANLNGPIVGTTAPNTLYGTSFNDRIEGLAGNDSIDAGSGNDLLLGGEGNDTLFSNDGADTLDGGAGNDVLYMDSDDVLMFGRGYGYETVYRSYDATGTLRFGANVAPSDIRFKGVYGGWLEVNIANTSDTLLLTYWFNSAKPQSTLANFEFADGTRWTYQDIRARISNVGTAGDDYLFGTGGAETLIGAAGNDAVSGDAGNDSLQGGDGVDALSGGAGADTLDGGTGGDQLSGGAGDDTYVFERGFGSDTVQEGVYGEVYATNTIVFGSGIRASEVIVTGDNQFTPGSQGNLYLTLFGSSDRLTLSRWFDTYASGINVVRFADGTVWDRAQLLQRFYALERGGRMYGSSTAEAMRGDDSADQMDGLEGNDLLEGMGGDDELFGDMGNDTLVGGGGDDLLLGGIGDDTYLFGLGDGADRIADYDRATGNDRLVFREGVLASNVIVTRENDDIALYITGGTTGQGDSVSIRWFGSNALKIESVVFHGGLTWSASQLERMALSYGSIAGTEGADTLAGTATADRLMGFGGNDALTGLAGNDTLNGGEGADTLDGGQGLDVMLGAGGDDRYLVNQVGDTVVEESNEGTDTVIASVSYALSEEVENLELAALSLIGTGNALANRITGSSGNDTLDGGLGADTLQGGLGDDTYVVDDSGDVVVEAAGGGIDHVLANVAWQMSDGVENLTLNAIEAWEGVGNALNNRIVGNANNNRLDGGAGADTLEGGDGSDSYVIDNVGDVIVEAAGQGYDQVESSLSHVLGTDFEGLILTGSANIDGTGNATNNNMYGNAGNNRLDGGVSNDFMEGGAGNDVYVVDNSSDWVQEYTDGGTDTVESRVSWTLESELEHLVLTGTSAINGTGNELNNALTGNSANNTLTGYEGNDTLNGGAGNDRMVGGTGNDTYVVDATGDIVTELANEGTDSVQSGITLTLGSNVENLALTGSGAINGTGNSLHNVVIGNGAVNTLSGAAGNDTLDGGAGNDTIDGGAGNDVLLFGRGDGLDTMREATADATVGKLNVLRFKAGIVQTDVTVVRVGTTLEARINGTSDVVVVTDFFYNNDPSSSRNPLQRIEFADGSAWDLAAIQQRAGASNSAPVVAAPLADRTALEGTALSFALPAGSFTDPNAGDVLTYSATLASGAALPSWLSFNASTRTFSGTPPTSALGTLSVRVTARDGGNLSVFDDFNLAVNVENKTLTGGTGADVLTGYSGNDSISGAASNDTLIGAAGNDTLDGGTGNDSMTGGAGNDLYRVDSSTDVVVEAASAGTDTVESSVSLTLVTNVENLTLTGTTAINGTGNTLDNVLTGNSANNTLTAGAGHDTINGGTGNDTMVGGAGNDTYTVNVSTDVVTELASEGTDLVQSAVTYTLGTNVENLTLLGTTALNGTGNTLNNTLTGNSAANVLTGGAGNDTLNGAAGADSLRGGTGDDVYWVDVSTDVLTENANEGIDSVNAGLTWTLATNFENLSLAGTGAFNGTGNTVANAITGNSGANTLTGLAGNDTLNGNGGNDTLIGGVGADTYVFNRGHGQDTVQENDTTANVRDSVQFASGITQANLSYQRVGNNLEALLSASTDKLVFTNWYLGNQYHVEDFRFGDGSVLTDTQVQGLVSAMASFSAPASVESGTSSTWRATQPDLVVSALG